MGSVRGDPDPRQRKITYSRENHFLAADTLFQSL
jgi:hypothetical protein